MAEGVSITTTCSSSRSFGRNFSIGASAFRSMRGGVMPRGKAMIRIYGVIVDEAVLDYKIDV